MDEFEETWDTCAICNEIITVEQSPKFYWEEVREEITPYEALLHDVDIDKLPKDPELERICRSCGATLQVNRKAEQLQGFKKRYWSLWDGIFNRDNLIKIVVTIFILVIAVGFAILVLGWYPFDIGY